MIDPARGMGRCADAVAPDRWRTARREVEIRLLILEAWARLGLTELALRVVGFRRLMRLVAACPTRPAAAGQARESLIHERIAVIEWAVKYQPLPSLCLARSVTLHQWLRQLGIASQVRLGVRKAGGHFAAHAWVEIDDSVVYESTDLAARYTPLVAGDGRPLAWGRS